MEADPRTEDTGRPRFGRMFPGLTAYRVPEQLIDDLAQRMVEDGGNLDHADLPAGYTYF